MNIDIIGGSGFIGTYLSLRFKELGLNFNILDIEQPRIKYLPYKHSDVRDSSSLEDSVTPGSVIINLAAIHRDDVQPTSLYFDTNVNGAKKICQVAEKKSIDHIIFTSSVAVYGQNTESASEESHPEPTNPYGESKLLAEQVFIKWQMRDPSKRTLTIIRPTVIFGPSNRGNFFNLINQIFQKKFLMIGDGKNKKSIAYVENLVDFILHVLKFPPGVHIYNYVDTPDLSMNHLIRLIYRSIGIDKRLLFGIPFVAGYLIGTMFDISAAVLNQKLPISRVRVRKFCSNSIFSTKAVNAGFKPRFSLTDAVEKTVKYEYDLFVKRKK
jgi:nucleoside-diphosphate-sugar epimerase